MDKTRLTESGALSGEGLLPPTGTAPSASTGTAPSPSAGTARSPYGPGNEPPGPEDLPTSLQGRYRLIRVLGQGGFANVYLARDSTLDQEVAIKVLRLGLASQNDRDRFMLEARIGARLRHPNIVNVFDILQTTDGLQMVMEYYPGGTLTERIRNRGALHPREAVDVIRQVALALAYAHRNGVIHRDVKPANIFMAGEGIVKLGDFGIARASVMNTQAQEFTQTGMIIGTPLYMPPEQSADSRDVDPRTDIYALGLTLYHALAGRPPRVVDLESVPEVFRRLIKQATAPERNERLVSAEQFIAMLDQIQERLTPGRHAATGATTAGGDTIILSGASGLSTAPPYSTETAIATPTPPSATTPPPLLTTPTPTPQPRPWQEAPRKAAATQSEIQEITREQPEVAPRPASARPEMKPEPAAPRPVVEVLEPMATPPRRRWLPIAGIVAVLALVAVLAAQNQRLRKKAANQTAAGATPVATPALTPAPTAPPTPAPPPNRPLPRPPNGRPGPGKLFKKTEGRPPLPANKAAIEAELKRKREAELRQAATPAPALAPIPLPTIAPPPAATPSPAVIPAPTPQDELATIKQAMLNYVIMMNRGETIKGLRDSDMKWVNFVGGTLLTDLQKSPDNPLAQLLYGFWSQQMKQPNARDYFNQAIDFDRQTSPSLGLTQTKIDNLWNDNAFWAQFK